MRLAMTVGYRVFVCDNMAFQGDFSPVLAKHTKNFSLIDSISVGVDRMQRNFEPMRRQIEIWKESLLPNEAAKLIIYRAFVEGELEAPKHLARRVHDLYFNPQYEEFAPPTRWSLANAFTSAFKELDPTQKNYFLRVDPEVENAKRALESTLPQYNRDWEQDLVRET